MSIAFDDADELVCARFMEVSPRHSRPALIDLKRSQVAARALERQTEPEARIPRRGADLNNAFRAHRFGEQPQRPPVNHRNVEVSLMVLGHPIEHCQDLLLGL